MKKIFLGTEPNKAADPSSIDKPDALTALAEVAAAWRDGR